MFEEGQSCCQGDAQLFSHSMSQLPSVTAIVTVVWPTWKAAKKPVEGFLKLESFVKFKNKPLPHFALVKAVTSRSAAVYPYQLRLPKTKNLDLMIVTF